jgi:methylthioribulose-1-phosphate dehydratase
MLEYRQACAELVETGRRFNGRGHAAATSGNYSARLGSGAIAVTRSGRHKGRLAEADFMRIDASGQPIDDGAPSAEAALHLMLYRRFSNVGAVLHWHSPQAVGFSRAVRAETWRFEGHEMLKAFPLVTTHETARTLVLIDNSQDMREIEAAVGPRLDAPDTLPAFLIRSHGAYAWGLDIAEAERVAEALEWLIAAELAERSFR